MEQEKNRKISINKNAIQEVEEVLAYLKNIQGKGILCGQHTQTMEQQELHYIKEHTGFFPALCGFELLAYSPNIHYEESGEACLKEVYENQNTLEKAWEWAQEKKGLITFTWHWFSPLGGRDKAFYTEHTDFDPIQATIEGTPENIAFVSDMDQMAEHLKKFAEAKIPILWRPFHESEGTWFWWGAKGPKIAAKLYQMMYNRYTEHHQLNHLIWVWNCPLEEGYVGDAYADILSVDVYLKPYEHIDYVEHYHKLRALTSADKIFALGEIGNLPSLKALEQSKVPWTYFMVWSYPFGATENNTKKEVLKEVYQNSYAITLERFSI
ncbi:MAG: beta-mannosidase [Vallitaleaceae bacterium]|nr:beta-mannosidase [Vallitaleaceae bacterium]